MQRRRAFVKNIGINKLASGLLVEVAKFFVGDALAAGLAVGNMAATYPGKKPEAKQAGLPADMAAHPKNNTAEQASKMTKKETEKEAEAPVQEGPAGTIPAYHSQAQQEQRQTPVGRQTESALAKPGKRDTAELGGLWTGEHNPIYELAAIPFRCANIIVSSLLSALLPGGASSGMTAAADKGMKEEASEKRGVNIGKMIGNVFDNKVKKVESHIKGVKDISLGVKINKNDVGFADVLESIGNANNLLNLHAEDYGSKYNLKHQEREIRETVRNVASAINDRNFGIENPSDDLKVLKEQKFEKIKELCNKSGVDEGKLLNHLGKNVTRNNVDEYKDIAVKKLGTISRFDPGRKEAISDSVSMKYAQVMDAKISEAKKGNNNGKFGIDLIVNEGGLLSCAKGIKEVYKAAGRDSSNPKIAKDRIKDLLKENKIDLSEEKGAKLISALKNSGLYKKREINKIEKIIRNNEKADAVDKAQEHMNSINNAQSTTAAPVSTGEKQENALKNSGALKEQAKSLVGSVRGGVRSGGANDSRSASALVTPRQQQESNQQQSAQR